MAVYKATQKKSDSVEKFKATEKRSYDSALVYDWQRKNKESYDTLEKYRQRINSGGYLSSDDIADYRKALDSYVGTSSNLRGISKAFGQGEVDDDKQWSDTISQMKSGYKSIADYYSQFASEKDYNDYQIGWLIPDAETNEKTVAARKNRYESNATRIEEIKKELPWYGDTILPSAVEGIFLNDEQEALKKELELLESDNLKYQRTQGVLDQYYHVTQKGDFGEVSANRDHGNPTRDELAMHDAFNDSSTWYYDENDILRDVYGNEIVKDASGRLVNPNAHKYAVKDRLGIYLNATEKDIEEYMGTIVSGTWGNVIGDGIDGSWDQLKENEIGIYYYLLNTSGQGAADKYLSDMKTELNRRQTLKTQEHINNAPVLEQIFMNIASVPMSVFGGVTSLAEDAANVIRGNDINPYSAAHSFQNTASTIRSDTASDINNLTGNVALPWVGTTFGDVYQSIMSFGDSTLASVIPGGHVLLGLNAASAEMKDLYERGGSTEQMLAGGILAGAAEMFFEKMSIDKLKAIRNMDQKAVKNFTDGFVKAIVMGGVEASEEMATEIANTISDALVMGSQTDWVDMGTFAKNVVNAGIGGFISGGLGGGIAAGINHAQYNQQVTEHGQSIIDQGGVDALQQLAAVMPNNKAIGKISNKVSSEATAKNVGKLSDVLVEAAQLPQETAEAAGDQVAADAAKTAQAQQTGAVESAGKWRQDTTAAVSEDGLTRQISTGKTVTPQKIVSIEGGKVMVQTDSGTVAAEDIAFGDKDTDLLWRSAVGFNGITPAGANGVIRAYRSGDSVTTYLTGAAQEFRNGYYNMDSGGEYADKLTPTQREIIYELGQKAAGDNTAKAQAQAAKAKKVVVSKKERVGEDSSVTEETAQEPVTLESASRKYGAQAQAMVHTYQAGQDVAKYDKAYQAAYDMGKSGVLFDYAKSSPAVSYLTDSQKELAYEAGSAASNMEAQELEAKNKAAANGKTGRKKGVVRGEGVTIADLKKTFNDTQSKAYKYLSTVAEVTGIDIVLYRSEAGADGKFHGAQGRYRRSEPGTIYIDLNAGISNIKSADDLAKYAMLRTFAHEFTHFIENWNPIQYNKFRKVVFDTLAERGENVQDLIEDKQACNPGMDYDKASREVVAEAMTDILPDANFVQELAQKHKNIFTKLLEKLKEFVNNLQDYYNSIGDNRSREDKALKEQIGDTVKYLDSIVQLFDKVAVQAVENYQQTVARREVIVSKTEMVAAPLDSAAQKPKKQSLKKPSDNENAEKTVKPETVQSSVKLEDFGEKIGGARKDQWSKRGLLSDDLTEMNDREREKNVKKDNVWKRPDYRKRIEGGEDRNVLFVRNEIRKALNQTIRYPYKASEERRLQIQKEFVDTVREIQTMAEKATSKEDFAAMGRQWLIANGYIDPSGKGYTDKWRKNPALQGSDYVYTIEHLVRNFDSLSKLADKANFAVDAEKKVPTGFAIHEDERNGTWFIAKGSWVIKHSIPSYEEALDLLRNAAATKKKKTRFVPQQLLEVHRKGPDYRGGKDINGQDYLDVFGFRGGEFGNWMNEKDRRVSMNYGFDALKDLADAMGIADGDISLSGNLSIAFGARGQGLSGAAAHYERERHVINLTKMNGAGSLAHEWFHALDDFIGGYGSNMATDSLRGLPERTKNALRDLLTVMQYRDATQEETDMAATKSYEQAKRSVTYQVNNQFNWVAKVENGTLTDADTRYYSRKPTAADAKRFHELLDKLLETGDAAIVDELSALRKEVNGRVIPKEDRESIGYRLYALKPTATKNVQKMRTRSDFYNNSRRFGELHQKDGDYWDSTVEMAARAFACYVADKTGKHNDYLSAHADSAVTLDMDKNGNLVPVRAYPVGQERKDINAAFDNMIDALKADGFLHDRGETVKPDDVQYQSREYLTDEDAVQEQSKGYLKNAEASKYSYEWFAAKPDMEVTSIDDSGIYRNNQSRKLVANLAVENAKAVGKVDPFGNAVVHVTDNGADVVVSKSGIKHSMDRRAEVIGPVAEKAGEILKNAIQINELNPREPHIKNSYILMGMAKNKKNEPYIVSFVVNRYTHELVEMEVVYSMNAKTEPAGSLSPRITAQNADSFTGSKITIADYLDFVNKYFPDVMPEAVLKHYGYDARPEGTLGEDVLYQQRTDTLTDRDVLSMVINEQITESTDAEKNALSIYKKHFAELEKLRKQRLDQEKKLKKQVEQKSSLSEIRKTKNRISTLNEAIKRESQKLTEIEKKPLLQQIRNKAFPVIEARILMEQKARLAEYRKQYGTIPAGEKAVRSDDLPKSTDGTNKVSRTARTVKGAVITPDDFADLIDAEVAEGGLTYLPISNNDTTQKAIAKITEEGWDGARYQWHSDVRAGKADAEMSAMGALLLNNAAKAGDRKVWLEVLADYQVMGTRAAQAVQALRILKTLSPSDKLYMLRKSVQKMVNDLKLESDVVIDEALIDEYNTATTDTQRDAIIIKIQKDVALQLPTSGMEMWTALRYVNMLGNFKTQVRNVLGNISMASTNRIKNAVAASLEVLVSKVSGGQIKRTKSITVSRDLLAACMKDFSEMESLALDGGKYSDAAASRLEKGIRDQKTVFKAPISVQNQKVRKAIELALKPMEAYRKATNKAMEKGDLLFSKGAYARALAGYLKAQGVTSADLTKVDTALLDEARAYAIKEAQEVTFRDHNALTELLASGKPGKGKLSRAVSAIGQGIMPFRQTPANILLRAEEYSPLGLVNSIALTLEAAAGKTDLVKRKGFLGNIARAGQQVNGAHIINSFAKTFTGSGLFVLGMIFANLGWAVGAPDDEEKKKKFDELNGRQNYALVFGDTSWTFDWLSPVAIPFFMGVNLQETISKEGLTVETIKGSLMSLTDPMMQMSMLQGLNGTLDELRYSDNSLLELGANALTDYALQGMTNSLLSQLERSFESKRQATYTDKNKAISTDTQYTLGKTSAKIPGWDYGQIPYINAWGETEENPPLLTNLLYNLFSPSYYRKDTTDSVAKELYRLDKAQEENVFPSTPEKTYTDGSGKHQLTADEYVELAKTQGQMQRKLVEKLIVNAKYNALSDTDKAKAIQFAYKYAKEYAQIVVLGRESFSAKWMRGIGKDAATAIIQHVKGQ